MKTLFKKYKFLLALFLILITLYITAISWHQGTLRGLREFYPLEKSGNKAASDEFIKAHAYFSHIETLHSYFDYDSVIMKPFMRRMDSHFEKAKALLPKDSIEDILWWVFFYSKRYELVIFSHRDSSLAYDKLSSKEFTMLHDKVYKMIERFPKGKNNFKIEKLENFTFRAYRTLVKFFYGQYLRKYDPENGKQVEQFEKDKEAKRRLEKIFHDYPLIKKRYLKDTAKNSRLLLDYKIDMVNITFDIILQELGLNNDKLSQDVCTSKEVDTLMRYSDSLIKEAKENNKIFKRIFDKKHRPALALFGHIVFNCSNVKPNARGIYNKIDQLNKEKYGGKR